MTGKSETAQIPTPQPVKFSKKIKHILEYAGLRAAAALILLMPRRQALGFGRFIGRIMNILMPSRRVIARNNILASLPGVTVNEADGLIQKCWENLGEGAAEFIKLPQLSREELFSFTQIEGLEYLQKSYGEGKGALIVTAHYGVWELGAKVWPMCGFKTAVVARRVKNPWVNDFVTGIRECGGVKVLLSRDAVRESVRWLKQGGALAVLVDHRVAEGGLSVPFFGRPALTTGLPALLALRYKVPVHPAHCWRENGKVKVHVAQKMDFDGLEANERDIAAATLRMNEVVENWVRKRPEAWLWIHNRWK